MTIVPDTKSWTWVLDRPCPECRLDTRTVSREQVPGLIDEDAAIWSVILSTHDPSALRARPADDRWSTLEYACHVRDVLTVCGGRFDCMLMDDYPEFPYWDQDETAVEARYGEQDPANVSAEVNDAAARLSGTLAQLPADSWTRLGRRSDGAEFTVETLARYMLHDVIHHVHDVREVTLRAR